MCGAQGTDTLLAEAEGASHLSHRREAEQEIVQGICDKLVQEMAATEAKQPLLATAMIAEYIAANLL